MKEKWIIVICMIMVMVMVLGCTSASACMLYSVPVERITAADGGEYIISCKDDVYIIRSTADTEPEVSEGGVIRYPSLHNSKIVYMRYYGVKAELGNRGTVPDEDVLLGEDGEYTWTAERCGKGFLFRNEAEPDVCIVIGSGFERKLGELVVTLWKTRGFKNVLCLN